MPAGGEFGAVDDDDLVICEELTDSEINISV